MQPVSDQAREDVSDLVEQGLQEPDIAAALEAYRNAERFAFLMQPPPAPPVIYSTGGNSDSARI